MSCLRSLCSGSLWPVLCVLCVLCVLFETRDAAAMFHVGASDLVLCDTTSICVFGVRMFQCVEENSLLPSGFYYQIREKTKTGKATENEVGRREEQERKGHWVEMQRSFYRSFRSRPSRRRFSSVSFLLLC